MTAVSTRTELHAIEDTEVRRTLFRGAMSKLGAAVNIITTDGPAGQVGFAATAVCSVTDDPPTLLVCLNRAASVYTAVTTNKVLCVNTLSAGHQPLSQLFGGKTPAAERFAAASWSILKTGAPALDDALVSFDCEIETMVSQGTHDVLFCRVVATSVRSEGQALFYYDRAYHEV